VSALLPRASSACQLNTRTRARCSSRQTMSGDLGLLCESQRNRRLPVYTEFWRGTGVRFRRA
jgi:hypothetical protein